MENNEKLLQETREKKIPELIKKYEKLVDNIFKAVGEPLPNFSNKFDEATGVVIVTNEQQLFNFIDARKSALSTANYMLNKINELELELYNPKALLKEEEDEIPATPINIAKQKALAKKAITQ